MYIKVDIKDLYRMCDSISGCCVLCGIEKIKVNLSVDHMLKAGWAGQDADLYDKKWSDINSNDSVDGKLTKALGEFSEFLRETADSYKTAQAESYDEAYKLPR
jgi:uncharacterized protein YukE